jgi:hypothetical protein
VQCCACCITSLHRLRRAGPVPALAQVRPDGDGAKPRVNRNNGIAPFDFVHVAVDSTRAEVNLVRLDEHVAAVLLARGQLQAFAVLVLRQRFAHVCGMRAAAALAQCVMQSRACQCGPRTRPRWLTVCILVRLLRPATVVRLDRPEHPVPQALVQADRQVVRHAREQVHAAQTREQSASRTSMGLHAPPPTLRAEAFAGDGGVKG